jgi:dimethylsulfoniopropionate demethylase
VTEAGVKAYTVYNHTLLPTVFDSLEEDYRHLKSHVQVWDVSCERQVEIRGPDAARLLRMLTPRDLGRFQIGQCFYAPMVDDRGGMLNDPVAVKLAEDRYWVSIADSDLLFWVKGLACGLKLDVTVEEPVVAPLAVQGPMAEELLARVFGESVHAIRFFRFARLPFEGREMIVARSGYSKQGGFEIYVEGTDLAEPLWDALFAAGQDLQVRAGCPNLIERVEAGLLSYGNDMTRENTPFECGLGRFCNLESARHAIGREALLREAASGPTRQIRSLAIGGAPLAHCSEAWPAFAGGSRIGQVTSAVWSPDFETNVAIAMIDNSHFEPGNVIEVDTPEGLRSAMVQEKAFI